MLTGFLGGADSANDVCFDPRNGDIVSVGSAANPSTGQIEFAVDRYLPNGTLDPKFGKAGEVLTSINGVDDEAYGVTVGANGFVVATGATAITSGGTTSETATVEYTSSGALDKKFGVGGIATTPIGQPAVADEVQINPNGGVLIAGGTTSTLSSVNPSAIEVDIVQYTATGRLDPTFHGGQPLVLNLGGANPGLARPFAPATSQSQAAMGVLAEEHAIVQAVGNLIVVANTGAGTTGIAEIKASGSKAYKLKLSLPPTLPDGSYFLLAKVDATAAVMNVNAADDMAATAAQVQVEDPFSGLTGPAVPTPTGLTAGARATVDVTLQNATGLPAKGTVGLQAFAGATATPSASDATLDTTKLKVSLPPDGSRVFPIRLLAPAGTYYLLVVLTPPFAANGSVTTDLLAGAMQLVVG